MFYYEKSTPSDEIIHKVNIFIKNKQFFDMDYLNFLYQYVNKNKHVDYLDFNILLLNELYTNGFFKNKNVYNSPEVFHVLDNSISGSTINNRSVYKASINDCQPIQHPRVYNNTSSKLIKCSLRNEIIKIDSIVYDVQKYTDYFNKINVNYFKTITNTFLNDIIYEIVIFIMKKYKRAKSLYLTTMIFDIKPFYNNKIDFYYMIESEFPYNNLNLYENYIGSYVEHKKYGSGVVINQKSTMYDRIRATDRDDCTLDVEFDDGQTRRFMMSILIENDLLTVMEF